MDISSSSDPINHIRDDFQKFIQEQPFCLLFCYIPDIYCTDSYLPLQEGERHTGLKLLMMNLSNITQITDNYIRSNSIYLNGNYAILDSLVKVVTSAQSAYYGCQP